MTNSMIKYETIFESTNNLPMQIAIGHGENADLVAGFTDGGVEVNLSGYTARAIYQPKSKWGTDDWYECSCEIEDNKVVAHWGNTYDNGDNAVKLFMHLVKDGKLAYPAIYQIRLFETPGFSPSAIEPIPKTIDFAQYQLENAPWVLPSDLSGYATKAEVPTKPSDIGAQPAGDYATTDSLSAYATAESLSSYATAESLSAYATAESLSSTNALLDSTIRFVGEVSQRIPYAKSNTLITQNNQLVMVGDRKVQGLTVLSNSVASKILLSLPTDDAEYVTDYIVDIDNQKQTALSVDFNGNEFSFYWFAVDEGESLTDILSIEGEKISRLYLTTTGVYREYIDVPMNVLHISKKVIEVVGHSEVE